MDRSSIFEAIDILTEANDKLRSINPSWRISTRSIVEIMDYDVEIETIKEYLSQNGIEETSQIANQNIDQAAPARQAASASMNENMVPRGRRRNRMAASTSTSTETQTRGRTQNRGRRGLEANNQETGTDKRRGRVREIPDEDKQRIADMYRKGFSIAQIAEAVGYSAASVSRYKNG